jgi:hypothetical protein
VSFGQALSCENGEKCQVVVPPVPIEPGTLSVGAFVTIVYELE